jgi:hypothetical protein
MPPLAIILPRLPAWAQQLAGILPLSALIEFSDIDTKLHVFELNSSVSLWNWPITPAGARLLLASEDTTDACCLDRPSRSIPLHSIDGRHGSIYPCSTPTTTRLYVSAQKVDFIIQNDSPNMADARARKQNLDIIHVLKQDPAVLSVRPRLLVDRLLENILRKGPIRQKSVSGIGWVCWVAMAVISLMASLYLALAYLLLMLLTGFIIQKTHGGPPRRLLDERICSSTRLVVVTSSLNGSDWWAFYGGSWSLNALLNQPLYRSATISAPKTLRLLLRLLILGQWVLAVGSSAQQDFNSIFISSWILFCACVNTYAFPPEKVTHDWLRYSGSIAIRRIRAKFSTRRAMLSALIYLNPDSKERRTEWINPILSNAQDRSDWESTMLDFTNNGSCNDETAKEKYWWKYVQEGLDVGRKIQEILDAPVGTQA